MEGSARLVDRAGAGTWSTTADGNVRRSFRPVGRPLFCHSHRDQHCGYDEAHGAR